MAVGLWVAVDPAGFQDIVATKAVLSAGAYLLLAVGIALALLGFLGCCGALRRSRPLLLGVSAGTGRGCGVRDVRGCGELGMGVLGDVGARGGSPNELPMGPGWSLTPPSHCLPVLHPGEPGLPHAARRGCSLLGALETGTVPTP